MPIKILKIISIIFLGGLLVIYAYASVYTNRLITPSEFLFLSRIAIQPANKPQIDAKPVEIHLSAPMPAGKAQAYFELYTGGDHMTERRSEAGLVLVVRYGSSEFRQTIASCQEPGIGNVLWDGTETELEVTYCNGEYWLITEAGKVLVQKGDRTKRDNIITQIPLPPGIDRAVKPDKANS